MIVNDDSSLKTILMKCIQWFVCKRKNVRERDREKKRRSMLKEGEKECVYL